MRFGLFAAVTVDAIGLEKGSNVFVEAVIEIDIDGGLCVGRCRAAGDECSQKHNRDCGSCSGRHGAPLSGQFVRRVLANTTTQNRTCCPDPLRHRKGQSAKTNSPCPAATATCCLP